jgi:uncharacterized protein YdeI (YjbR/CyaY-like superfamily)
MAPVFFESARAFREWLDAHHATEQELWLGFYKKGSGRTGLTYLEAVDEALCYGWIDGKLRRIDGVCHQVRFTPRKPTSSWSAINIRKVSELTKAGRMTPAGLAVFDARRRAGGPYEAGAAPLVFSPAYAKRLRGNKAAWRFFEAQPPWYRRNTQFWVMSAKREETRERRLTLLVDACARGERLGPFSMQPAKRNPSATA